MTEATLENPTAGFYNTLTSALNLSDKQFQLVQGALPVQSASTGFYNYVDGIPPKSVAVLYTSNPVNGLNGNMQKIIGQAEPGFITKLAEHNYMDPTNWVDGQVGIDPLYSPAFASLLQQVHAGSSGAVSYDSATASTSLSTAWAQSASYGGIGFWGTSSSSVSAALNATAADSEITVDVALDNYAYLPVRAGGWFSQALFTNQYQNSGDWQGGQDAWDKVFGSAGSCTNVANQVLLVAGYTATITSHAAYTEADYSMIQTSSDTNVWPFYSSSSHSAATQSFTHNSDQSITVTIKSPATHLQIMGVGVVKVAEMMHPTTVARAV